MKKSSKILLIVLSFVLGASVVAAMSAGVIFFVKALGEKGTSASEPVMNTAPRQALETTTLIDNFINDDVTDLSGIVEEAMPSVVSISCTTSQTYYGFFGSYDRDYNDNGSGIIYEINNDEILIMTNSHLVYGSKDLKVMFNDGEVYDGILSASDVNADLALIKVKRANMKAATVRAIRAAEFGTSEDVKTGQISLAIGNALGYGQSLTVGYISATDREINIDGTVMNLIQTDAAINPGNDGGPLLNLEGKVIGINSVKYSSTSVEGMGYAIPISKALPVMNDLYAKKTSDDERGYFGIYYTVVSDDLHQAYNIPYGLYVSEVMDGQAAYHAGIYKADVIIAVNDTETLDSEALNSELSKWKVGDTVKVKLLRYYRGSYEEMTLDVTLTAKTWD